MIGLLSFLLSSSVFALQIAPSASLQFARGGDKLSSATGGQDYHMQGGDTIGGLVGVLIPVSLTKPSRFEAQVSTGYFFADSGRDVKQSITWSHIPIEALYFYRQTEKLYRLGWGVTYQLANNLTGKGENAGVRARAENAWGFLLQAEYILPNPERFDYGMGIGLGYRWIQYDAPQFSRTVDGSAIYLSLSIVSN